MKNQFYCDILQVDHGAEADEIKKSFRKLARKNHPDFFPHEYKEVQKLKMIQINEAYRYLLQNCKNIKQDKSKSSKSAGEKTQSFKETWDKYQKNKLNNLTASTHIGEHKDPAYAYYKQGFVNFSKGLHGIMSDTPYKIKTDVQGIKEWASGSLVHFKKSHTYFSTVVFDYPDSIWSVDAQEKLNRIENFSILYKRILLNIKKKFASEE